MSCTSTVKITAEDVVSIYWQLLESGVINEWSEVVKPTNVYVGEDQVTIVTEGE